MKIRYFFLFLIVCFGVIIMILFFQYKPQFQLQSTISPAFQVLGKSTKSVDTVIANVLPINSIDEKLFGDAIEKKYEGTINIKTKDSEYVNDLLKNISSFSKKPFKYKAFIINSANPNACAMPGGVIIITTGLINEIESESELVAVLAHEMGHIELSHCFNAVKYRLTLDKVKLAKIGDLADFSIHVLINHSFSKTLEDEADEYAYKILLMTPYTPFGLSNAFVSISKSDKLAEHKKSDFIRDYIDSHPDIILRIEKYKEKATNWVKNNPQKIRYTGKENLKNRISFYKKKFK
jgi:beta-barrel assembly-enhancing protease